MANNQYDHLFKIMIIGESGVGKTNLLLKLVENSFTENHLSTIGIENKIKIFELEDKLIRTDIWDTAGEARFRSMITPYYKAANGFVLVFDVTNENSFVEVRTWIKEIQKYATPDAKMVIVGNKCDEQIREVQFEDGYNLSKEFNTQYFEASAKTDENVNVLFLYLVREILNKSQLTNQKRENNKSGKIEPPAQQKFSNLDNFFQDSIQTTNYNNNQDDLLNKFFNDTNQTKAKITDNFNMTGSMRFETKNDDIFNLLDQTAPRDNQTKKQGNNDIFNNFFDDTSSKAPDKNGGGAIDLDEMLRELTRTVDKNANDLKNYNEKLLGNLPNSHTEDNFKPQPVVLKPALNTHAKSRDNSVNYFDDSKHDNKSNNASNKHLPLVNEEEEGAKHEMLNKSKNSIFGNSKLDKSTNSINAQLLNKSGINKSQINNEQPKDSVLKPLKITETNNLVKNSQKDEMNKSGLSKASQPDTKLVGNFNKSPLLNQSKKESNNLISDLNKSGMSKLSKKEEPRDELNKSNVSKKEDLLVTNNGEEVLNKSGISKASKQDKISSKLGASNNNLRQMDYNYNLLQKDNLNTSVNKPQPTLNLETENNKEPNIYNETNDFLPTEFDLLSADRNKDPYVIPNDKSSIIMQHSDRDNNQLKNEEPPLEELKAVKLNPYQLRQNNAKQQSTQKSQVERVNLTNANPNANDLRNNKSVIVPTSIRTKLDNSKILSSNNLVNSSLVANQNLRENKQNFLEKPINNQLSTSVIRESKQYVDTNENNSVRASKAKLPAENNFGDGRQSKLSVSKLPEQAQVFRQAEPEFEIENVPLVKDDRVNNDIQLTSTSVNPNKNEKKLSMRNFSDNQDDSSFKIDTYDIVTIPEKEDKTQNQAVIKPPEQVVTAKQQNLDDSVPEANCDEVRQEENEQFLDGKKAEQQEAFKVVLSQRDKQKPQEKQSIVKEESNKAEGRFSFFDKFQEQAKVESSTKKGDTNNFFDFDMNPIKTQANNEMNVFQSIENNLSSRNKQQEPVVKSSIQENPSAKFNIMESNDYAVSAGRQSEKQFISKPGGNFDQTFKPFKENNVEGEFHLHTVENLKDMSQNKEAEESKNLEKRNEGPSSPTKLDKLISNSNNDEKYFLSNNKEGFNLDKSSDNKHVDIEAICMVNEEDYPKPDNTEKRSPSKRTTKNVNLPQTNPSFEKQASVNFQSPSTDQVQEETKQPTKPKKEAKKSEKTVDNKSSISSSKETAGKKQLELKGNIPEKFFGKLVIGKEEDIEMKGKKEHIIADNTFTILRNNGLNDLKFDPLPPYFNEEEEKVIFQTKNDLAEIISEPTYNSLKTRVSKLKLTDNSIQRGRSFYEMKDIGFFFSLSECAENLCNYFQSFERFCSFQIDGNGFYKTFIFALIETYILEKKEKEFYYLVYDFKNLIDKEFKKNNPVLDSKEALMVFSIILSFLESGDIVKSYVTFVNAFDQLPNFQQALIKYVRLVAAKFYIERVEDLYKSPGQQVMNFLSHPAYITRNGFNPHGFMDECILSMNYEAKNIIYYILPIAFKVNVELHIFECSFANNPNLARIWKETLHSQDEQCTTNITLIYRITQFDILYSKERVDKFRQALIQLPLTSPESLQNKLKMTEGFNCNNCEAKISVEIQGDKYLPTCLNCLQVFLKERMFERAKNFIAGNFNNLEYYCRNIMLNEDVFLSCEDLLIVLKQTTTQFFLSTITSLCESCKKHVDEKDFKLLDCKEYECRVCSSCLLSKVKLLTENKVCFNTFEIQFTKLPLIACFCGGEFNYNDAIKKFHDEEIKEFVNEADERLQQQVQEHCLGCGNEVPKEEVKKFDPESGQDVPTSKPKSFTVKIAQQGSRPIADHRICVKCFKVGKSSMDETSNVDQVHCYLCDSSHGIDPRLWTNKTGDKCACDCIIF